MKIFTATKNTGARMLIVLLVAILFVTFITRWNILLLVSQGNNLYKTQDDIEMKFGRDIDEKSLENSEINRPTSSNQSLQTFPYSSYDLVVGIPSVKRPNGKLYLLDTLDSLLRNRDSSYNCAFLTYLAETDTTVQEEMSSAIKKRFSNEVETGLIMIILPPDDLYPDWDKELRITLGDPPHQVKWRSKQSLDRAYMLEYAHKMNGKYFLMLEDDVTAVEGYMATMMKHAASMSKDVIYMSYCQQGAIGKLFPHNILQTLATFIRVLFNDKPVDWIIFDFLRVRVCRYPATTCDEDVRKIAINFPTNLFLHKGMVSSLIRHPK